ncbi:hypothetical protein ACVBR5_000911 [Burkholderia cenocepacia]
MKQGLQIAALVIVGGAIMSVAALPLDLTHWLMVFVAMAAIDRAAYLHGLAHGRCRDRDKFLRDISHLHLRLEHCRVLAFGADAYVPRPHPCWSPALDSVRAARVELERTRAAYAEECERSNTLCAELARLKGD